MPVIYFFYPGLTEVMAEHCESETWHGMVHACEFETSLMLAMYPEHVQMEKAVAEYPDKPSLYGKSSVSLGDLSQSGVYGDPTKATKEKGQLMLDAFVKAISDDLGEAFTMVQERKLSR